MEGLTGKVIVFAGAGGIATATAAHLGQRGAKVVVGDVLLASAELTARTCGDAAARESPPPPISRMKRRSRT